MKFLLIAFALCSSQLVHAAEVRLYSERHYSADKTIFGQFTKKTGIKVKVVKAGGNELLSRMKAEKANPQADLYLAVDAAALDRANDAGLLSPIPVSYTHLTLPTKIV